MEMIYEVFADKNGLDEWRAEAIAEDGSCYVTIFSGPNAENRARGFGNLGVVLQALESSDPVQNYSAENDRHNNAIASVRMILEG